MSKKINIPWIVFGAVAGAALYLLLWWIFDCFACRAVDHLRNLIFLTGGITAAMIAAWRAQVADEQAKTESKKAETENKKANTAEKAHITDRFARAIEQLNNENIYMRIGAIQALERIGYDSEDDVLGVLRLLAGFIRDQSPVKNKDDGINLPSDAKEGMGAIWRLAGDYKELLKKDKKSRLDLSATNLAPFPLITEGYFYRFDFGRSNITGGFLQSNFEWASFFGTDLTHTIFSNCNFRHASFMGALLDSAQFYGSDMFKADLSLATCNNTDFSTAKNLTTEMLESIIYDAKTPPKVPKGIILPPPTENKTVPGLLPSIA